MTPLEFRAELQRALSPLRAELAALHAQMNRPQLLTVAQAAEQLGCSRVTVWRHVRAGKLRQVQTSIGPRVLLERSA